MLIELAMISRDRKWFYDHGDIGYADDCGNAEAEMSVFGSAKSTANA
jgi:hypothetical protein